MEYTRELSKVDQGCSKGRNGTSRANWTTIEVKCIKMSNLPPCGYRLPIISWSTSGDCCWHTRKARLPPWLKSTHPRRKSTHVLSKTQWAQYSIHFDTSVLIWRKKQVNSPHTARTSSKTLSFYWFSAVFWKQNPTRHKMRVKRWRFSLLGIRPDPVSNKRIKINHTDPKPDGFSGISWDLMVNVSPFWESVPPS